MIQERLHLALRVFKGNMGYLYLLHNTCPPKKPIVEMASTRLYRNSLYFFFTHIARAINVLTFQMVN